MPRPTQNLTGKVYGELRVLALSTSDRDHATRWLCQCNCGKKKIIRAASLKSGNSKTCGCSRGNFHGLRNSPLYGTWKMMIHRCYNPKSRSYERYGGRNIRVCKRWRYNPENFIKDMGKRPHGMTLDRKNPNGNYNKDNCRWATPKQQANNRRKK